MSGRSFAVSTPTCRCGGACGHGTDPEETTGSNAGDGPDPEQVADLADRSAFTKEQIRDMTEVEREKLAETLDRRRDSEGPASDPEWQGGSLTTLAARETARERAESDETLPNDLSVVGALTTLSQRETNDRGR